MRAFKRLQKKLHYLKPEQVDLIRRAFTMAYEGHSGQKRTSGEDYILHPLAVAITLAEMRMDGESIAAALLHDILEDTPLQKEIIVEKFGEDVAELVDGVTKLTKMQFSTHAEAQAESFRKMILAMSHDIRVILIKLADRLHNMRTLSSLASHKRRRIAKETLEIYAPIANRLGMHDIFIELESLGFSALFPVRHKILDEARKKARGNRKEIISVIEKDIKKQFLASPLANSIISGREKHIYSIYKKMIRKHLSFSDIMDVYAFRIIVETIDDCYRALGIVHNLYKPVPGRFKDYIAIPKVNGYQSLHTTLFGPHGVPIEIQIRTEEMDQIANKGIAAHWLYKSSEKFDETHIRAQQWINNLLELQKKTGSSLEFIENVKIDLFPEEIYLFTPRGGIIKLPRGSTVVDFAYAVHTAVGNTCVAARIDRQFAPLSTELTSGQTVAIITAPDSKPNPIWLNFVKTAKARSSIRVYLKNQKSAESVALGRQLLENALAEHTLSLNKIPKKAFTLFFQEANIENFDALCYEIGQGKRVANIVAHQLINASQRKSLIKKEAEPTKEQPLLIRGAEGMAITFATCCYPVPGDSIAGCLITDEGLTIHRDNCKHIAKYRNHPEKCILVRWSDDVKGEFPVKIMVQMSSKRGSFAALTRSISDCDANIEDITVTERIGEYFLTTLKVYVHNRDHLNHLLRHIANLKAIISVTRL